MIRSRVVVDEQVSNKVRRFGSLTAYLPAIVEQCGHETRALFTPSQIHEAIKRYRANREDWPAVDCPKWAEQ